MQVQRPQERQRAVWALLYARKPKKHTGRAAGGYAAAAKLDEEQRRERASNAAKARWSRA